MNRKYTAACCAVVAAFAGGFVSTRTLMEPADSADVVDSAAVVEQDNAAPESNLGFAQVTNKPVTPVEPQVTTDSTADSPQQELSEAEQFKQNQARIRAEIEQQKKQAALPTPIPEPEAETIRMHPAPLDDRRLTPGNFEYHGAFRLPAVTDSKSRFGYGGFTLAFRPDGDAGSADDGYPGSLFTVGHDSHQLVAEINIPKPRYLVDRRGKDLPAAKLLQDFNDISAGFIRKQSRGTEPFKIGGLFVAGNRLHWTLYKYYNVDGARYDSHATSSLNLAKPQPEGLWHLGNMNGGGAEWHSYKYAGYIFDVPPERAKNDLGGLNLISGLQISTGRQTSSQGPAMYAYRLPKRGTERGASLDAVPLLYYPLNAGEWEHHHPSDMWRGGAWIKVGRKEGIIIAGRKALGEVYYGEARKKDCTPDKGYHGTPYEPQVVFYDVEDILQVARGKTKPWFIDPYLTWSSKTEGGGLKEYFFDTCAGRLEGVAFDRKNSLLYMIQYDATLIEMTDFEKIPIVHVFKIKDV